MPVVRLPRAGLPGWAIGVAAVVAGLLLFLLLDARRQDRGIAPAVAERASDSLGAAAPPPPLLVPVVPQPPVVIPAPAPAPAAAAPAPQPRIVYVPQPYPVPTAAPAPEAPGAAAAARRQRARARLRCRCRGRRADRWRRPRRARRPQPLLAGASPIGWRQGAGRRVRQPRHHRGAGNARSRPCWKRRSIRPGPVSPARSSRATCAASTAAGS